MAKAEDLSSGYIDQNTEQAESTRRCKIVWEKAQYTNDAGSWNDDSRFYIDGNNKIWLVHYNSHKNVTCGSQSSLGEIYSMSSDDRVYQMKIEGNEIVRYTKFLENNKYTPGKIVRVVLGERL